MRHRRAKGKEAMTTRTFKLWPLWFMGLLCFGTNLVACSEYGLRRVDTVSPPRGDIESMELTEFRDCSEVLGDNYWYEDHEFGVIFLYGGCLAVEPNAYLIVEHEFWDMDKAPVQVTYETLNNDVVTVDAWKYTLDFWYNPVDIELEVIPYQENIALGIHEFTLNCVDDDQMECDVEYTGSVDEQDFN